MTTARHVDPRPTHAPADCCGPAGLWGWSPPNLPADTPWKERVDRLLPRTGVPAVLYFAGVVVLLNIGQLMPRRWALLTLAIAALGAGSWCALNFWRCRHAHCVVTGTGWLALGAFTLVEAGMGRSLISGDEGVAFLAVLAAGLVFECAWRASRGSNAITARFPGSAGTTR